MSALERLLREGDDGDVRRFFNLLRPPELADVLEQLPDDLRLRAIRLMGPPLAAEVLHSVEDSDREEILEDLSASERADIVHESRSDDAADLLEAMSDEDREETLERLDPEEREEIEELLEYGEETAGGIMQTEVVTVRDNLTVLQGIEAVRGADIEDVGEIHEVFVVDADGRLVGAISPADMLQADPETALRDVLEPNPVTVPVSMDQEKIAEQAREHDLATIPVVDAQGVLVGQILHDDIADVLEEEATEDIARMAGADPEEVAFDSVLMSVRSRTPWLFPAFVGGLLMTFILKGFEHDLKSAALLAVFLPIVIGMAGNVGSQAAVITIRKIALGRLETFSMAVLVREARVGLSLGLIFGTVLSLVALVIGGTLYAMAVGAAIFSAMTIGTLLGVSVPLILLKLKRDPAVASTPFVATANDVIGVLVMFVVAQAFGII